MNRGRRRGDTKSRHWRGLQILEFLAERPDGAAPAEVAARLRLPKPSVFRMLVTLAEHARQISTRFH